MAGDKALGLAIKARREFLDVSQEQLAKVLDIDPQNISRYETGRQAISLARLNQIAEALYSAAPILMTIAENVTITRVYPKREDTGTPVVPKHRFKAAGKTAAKKNERQA